MSPEMPKEVNTDERVTPLTDPVAQPDDAQKTITIDIVRHKRLFELLESPSLALCDSHRAVCRSGLCGAGGQEFLSLQCHQDQYLWRHHHADRRQGGDILAVQHGRTVGQLGHRGQEERAYIHPGIGRSQYRHTLSGRRSQRGPPAWLRMGGHRGL